MVVRAESPIYRIYSEAPKPTRRSLSMIKMWQRPGHRDRVSHALTGHEVLPGTRIKISQTKKERNKNRIIRFSPMHKRHIGEAHSLKMKTDPEYQAMVRKRNKEISNRPAVKELRRKNRLGKKMGPEFSKRNGEIKKAYWRRKSYDNLWNQVKNDRLLAQLIHRNYLTQQEAENIAIFFSRSGKSEPPPQELAAILERIRSGVDLLNLAS